MIFNQAMTSLIENGKVLRLPSDRGWAFDTYRLTRPHEDIGDVG